MRSYLKKTHHKKRAGGMAQGVGPEFKPQYHKKEGKKSVPPPQVPPSSKAISYLLTDYVLNLLSDQMFEMQNRVS
jgi:hypothetical protein